MIAQARKGGVTEIVSHETMCVTTQNVSDAFVSETLLVNRQSPAR